jgi:hypothetical protein
LKSELDGHFLVMAPSMIFEEGIERNWELESCKRMPDPRGVGPPTDVTMLWTGRPEEKIDLKTHKRTGYQRDYGIPTSFFETPGNNAFEYGTIGLVGCSAFTVVKTPTPASPNFGFYMAHIWE